MFAKRALVYAAIATLLIATTGCSGKFRLVSDGKDAEITVAAASDLKIPLTRIARGFERTTGAKINLLFGSSGLMARQIENGAPIDIYIPASKKFVDQLAAKNMVGVSKAYARSFVVLIGKARTHGDLLLPEIKRIAIANPKHAPFGVAAVEILKNDGNWDKVKDKLVYAENVASAFELVKTGNADAGFVALSLAKPAKIGYTLINARYYKPIDVWMAAIKKTQRPHTVKAFMKYLEAPIPLDTLETGGLRPLTPDKDIAP